jgi:hypothetical protein
MTRDAAVGFHRRVFEREWSLLVGVTLHARSVSSDCQTRLFQFETTVWVVAVSASHGSFENLVMRRHVELVFDFTVTTETKLRLADLQQLDGREVGLFCIRGGDELDRRRNVSSGDLAV